jgi:hypothetical protein
MSRCKTCNQDGLLFVREPVEGWYAVLACPCPCGAKWRVKWQLRAYVETLEPKPAWFGRLEDFFDAKEIATLHPTVKEHQVRHGKECVS